jgi:hypothetical protein
MRRIRFIADDACREDMGGFGLQRWYRFEKRYAASIPPVVVIANHKYRNATLWEKFKQRLIADSDPSALRESAHRALRAKKAREAAADG